MRVPVGTPLPVLLERLLGGVFSRGTVALELDVDCMKLGGRYWFAADHVVGAIDELAEKLEQNRAREVCVVQLRALAYGFRRCVLHDPSLDV